MAGNNEQQYYTGSRDFNVVVDHYGDAKGTKGEFKDSHPEQIDSLIAGIYRTNRFAYETLAPELEGIKKDLAACWQGENADDALAIVATLTKDAGTIGENTRKCGDALSTFQGEWVHLKNQASGLYEGVAGTGYHQDNDGAHRIYDTFTKSMDTAMHAMPSELTYHTPLSGGHDNQLPPGGPGVPGGPGPGIGPGVGPGGIGPGTPGIGPGDGPGHGPGPGFGPGPGIGPGHGGIGPGGIGPGTGIDTGANLAGFDGGGGGIGPGAGTGSGLGPGAGIGPGAGAGLSGGAAGGGAGLPGGGAGAGGAGAAAAGGRGMMPMHGGGGGDEEERERTTWLTEDDDVWGGEDGLPPVLQ